MEQERQKEQQHFDETIALLKENVKEYREREIRLKQESDDLFAAVTKGGETELYNQLAASLSILEHTRGTLRKNEAALNKPYFGRIDYDDRENNAFESLYIGKNGISQDQEVVIVDWRGRGARVEDGEEGDYEAAMDLLKGRYARHSYVEAENATYFQLEEGVLSLSRFENGEQKQIVTVNLQITK